MALTLPGLLGLAWLLGLLALWAMLLFGGFAFGKSNADRTRRMPNWTRVGSSVALVLAAWSWWLFARDPASSTVALLIALGMTLGLIGDLFLAGVFPLRDPTFGGIAAFGLGHVAYIAALVTFGHAHRLDAPVPRFVALALWLLVGLAGWYLVVARGRQPSLLRGAALPYALLLAGTAGVATGLALQDSACAPVALGAALFLLSDLILAGEMFNRLTFPLIGDIVWLTYGPAQALIVFGAAVAVRPLGSG
jgi:hypothetical protein